MRKIQRRDEEPQLIMFATAILSLPALAEFVFSQGRGPLAIVGETLLRASERETELRASGDWFETWLSLLGILRGIEWSPGTFLPSAVMMLLLLEKLDLSDALGAALALMGAFAFAGLPTLPVPCFFGAALVFFAAPFWGGLALALLCSVSNAEGRAGVELFCDFNDGSRWLPVPPWNGESFLGSSSWELLGRLVVLLWGSRGSGRDSYGFIPVYGGRVCC